MPREVEQQFREAVALHRLGRLADAAKAYERTLQLDPRHADALHLLGVIALQSGQAQRAVELITGSLAIRPDHAEALCNLGNGHRRLGRVTEALANYDRALALNPHFADALANRGAALLDIGQPQAALEAFDALIATKPDHAQAHCNRGAALQLLKRLPEALTCFDRAIAMNPNMAEAHANRGNLLRELGRPAEALESCDKAISLHPRYVGACVFRGYALLELGRPQEALQSFDGALALNADNPRALTGRGRALFDLGQARDALACYDAALLRASDSSQAHFHRAIALTELGLHQEAVEAATRALALSPDLHGAYICRANALLELGQAEASLRDYERLVGLAPDLDYALGHYLYAKATLCDWDGVDALVGRLAERIEAGQRASYPFPLLAFCDSPELLLRSATLHAPAETPVHGVSTPLCGSTAERIKIAYFSSDFFDHPAAHLVGGMLANHDRERFEVFAYSFGLRGDEFTERIRGSVDHFVEVSSLTVQRIVEHARAERIDVAIDLNGYTRHARTRVFATRVAPVQMSYLGYLGTMGASYIDYLIADAVLIPERERAYYAEKLVLLPWYQCNDESANAPGDARPRADYGLPEEGFVFCSFNSCFKITPALFATWMRILERTPGSVLWLYAGHPAAARNLVAEAAKLGIAANRIVYAEKAPRAEHLARQRVADLMLDTSPYNGGATSSNALRAGLPVLTLAGRTFSSRMGASLMSALDLKELIADSHQAYEDMAVRLATRTDEITALKCKIAVAPLSELFNAKAITSHFERAYVTAVGRARAGLPPEDIVVQ